MSEKRYKHWKNAEKYLSSDALNNYRCFQNQILSCLVKISRCRKNSQMPRIIPSDAKSPDIINMSVRQCKHCARCAYLTVALQSQFSNIWQPNSVTSGLVNNQQTPVRQRNSRLAENIVAVCESVLYFQPNIFRTPRRVAKNIWGVAEI